MPQALHKSTDYTDYTDGASGVEGLLTIDQAARLLGRTARTIRRWCASGRLAARAVDTPRGTTWLIDPACRSELRIATGDVTAPVIAGTELAGLSADHRHRVCRRMELVEAYLAAEAAKSIYETLGHVRRVFLDAWNLQQRARGAAGSPAVALRTLEKYVAAYRSAGISGLVDQRARNGRGSTICLGAQQFILGLFLDENRPSLPYIYELAESAARREGWSLPGLRAVGAWLERQDNKLKLAGRSPKRFRDRCTPYVVRDWTKIAAMECIVGDHHQFDILWPRLVHNKLKKRLEWSWFRPWLSAWLDARSWHPFSHTVAFDSPDGDRVMGSFLKGVLEHGIPGQVYLDNGKDYRMYRFAGGRKKPARKGERIVAERHVAPVLKMLGVGVTWAIPYNAKAKIIEPWFKIVAERFSKRFDSYCGNKPERRPERLKKLYSKAAEHAAKLFGDDAMSRLANLTDPADQPARDRICLHAFRQVFNRWLHADYALRESPAAAARGLSAQRAFCELRGKDFVVRRPAEGDLALMLMPVKAVTVRQNGVWVGEFGSFYWSDDLEELRCNGGRSRVIYRFNPDDPSRIYVSDAKSDRFLAIATPYIGSGIHPLAAHGSADAEKLSDALALQRRIGRETRREVRSARKFAAGILLDAQRDAAAGLGRLDEPAAAPAAPVAIPLAGELSRAAQAAREHEERREAESKAQRFYASTGTDDDDKQDAETASAGPSALELMAEHNRESDDDDENDVEDGELNAS